VVNDSTRNPARSQGAWRLLTGVLALQAIGSLALAWVAITGFLGATNDPFADRMSVLIIAIAAVIWVIATLAGAVRGMGWARGSNLTLQILTIAAASGILQGMLGPEVPSAPVIGWGLIVLAIAGIFGSLLSRPADRIAERPEL
jgi:phosphatidylglycerophosphate synthase